MARQGLSRERVIQAAVCLIEERGIARFSMGQLAERLQVKTASLYNHVESLERLLEYVGEAAVSRLARLEEQAIAGKRREEALFALAEAYRAFAREHWELYRVILALPGWNNPALEQEAGAIVAPILQVLAGYGLDEERQAHWQRVLRAVMSGFAVHEQSGGFSLLPADRDESFQIAVRCVEDGLRRAGGEAL